MPQIMYSNIVLQTAFNLVSCLFQRFLIQAFFASKKKFKKLGKQAKRKQI